MAGNSTFGFGSGGSGGGGGSQTWQQVLDNGSVLNKGNSIDGGGHYIDFQNFSSQNFNAGDIGLHSTNNITLNARSGLKLITALGSFFSIFKTDNVTTLNRTNQMPDQNGTFALSVNGNFADAAGDITLGGLDSLWTATGNDIANNNSGNVTIGQGSNSRLTIDPNNSTLDWYSNDPYFKLDGANRRFQMGDYTYDWYGTYIDINDDVAERKINYHANNGHFFYNAGSNSMLTVEPNALNQYDGVGSLIFSSSKTGGFQFYQTNGSHRDEVLDMENSGQSTFRSINGANSSYLQRFYIGSNDDIIDITTTNSNFNVLSAAGLGGNINADGQLSLMSGNAGIFNDGRVIGYDINTPITTLYTSGNGDFYIQDKTHQNKTLDLHPDQTIGFKVFDATDGNNYFTANSDYISTQNSGGNYFRLRNTNITSNRNRDLVDASGYEVLSVNGVASGSNGNVSLTSANFGVAHTIFTPTTGGTITLTNKNYNIINPAGALLALTINLPSSPSNNDFVELKYTQGITTVTFSGGTVQSAITTPVTGQLVKLVFDSNSGIWY
jgi:hypothetical protein